jgi:hypothetical protein
VQHRISPVGFRRGSSYTRAVVRDAGDPVVGAKVTAQGKSGLTNARGKVTLAVKGRKRFVTARSTAAGYTGEDVRMKVLRK